MRCKDLAWQTGLSAAIDAKGLFRQVANLGEGTPSRARLVTSCQSEADRDLRQSLDRKSDLRLKSPYGATTAVGNGYSGK
jgi:hypothetical protein